MSKNSPQNGLLCKRVMNQLKSQLKMKTEEQKPDWKEVVVEIILKIITLGLYHVEKHKMK